MSGGPEQSSQPAPPDGPWGSLLPEESGFVAFWSDPEPPRLEEVIAAVQGFLGIREGGDSEWPGDDASAAEQREGEGGDAHPVELDDSSALWGMQLTIPSVRSAVILWAEPASPLGEPEREMLGREAAESPWIIRAQTVLGPTTATADYFHVVSLLAGSLAKVNGILDVVTSQFFPPKRLQQLFLDKDAAPIDHALWRLGRFDQAESSGDGESHSLLMTTGLRRCGIPELELVDVPANLVQAGVVLLHTLASLLLESPMPAPGITLEIGDGIAVSLVRSSEVSKRLPEGLPGSAAWRSRMVQGGMAQFGEETAVVIAADGSSPGSACPRSVLETIESGQAVLYVSTNEAEADLRRAQATFGTFATAFASLHRRDHPDWSAIAERSFLVQAPLDEATPVAAEAEPAPTKSSTSAQDAPPPAEDDHVEQVWMEVHSIERTGVRGRLLVSPRSRPSLLAGQEFVVPSSLVTNWRVEFPERSFGPSESEDLLLEVDRLRGLGAGPGN